MISYFQYFILVFMNIIWIWKNGHGHGSHSSTCVDDGEVLFLGHHVA